MAILHILILSLINLINFSYSVPSQGIIDAIEILSNSGYLSMALTLELVASPIELAESPATTLFAPPDSSFIESGQPSLSLLRFHFSPVAFSLENLQSLPFGSKIPTFSQGDYIYITSDYNHSLSINNVTVNGSPIFDDGSLVIFGIEDFFDQNYLLSSPVNKSGHDFGCAVAKRDETENSNYSYRFEEASEVLRTRGYSVMSSFLDLQLLGSSNDQIKMTVFAPNDEVMTRYVGNYSEYALIFLRHVVPCRLSWIDLVNLDDGTMLRTYSSEFMINVTLPDDSDTLMLNGVSLNFPNLYSDDLLVVHGVHDILAVPEVAGTANEEDLASSEERKAREIDDDEQGEF